MDAQTGGHAGQSVATDRLRLWESGLQLVGQQAQASGAACEVQGVQFTGLQARLLHGFNRAVHNALQVGGQGLFGFGVGSADCLAVWLGAR